MSGAIREKKFFAPLNRIAVKQIHCDRGEIINVKARSASFEVARFGLLANGLLHHSLGQRPRSTENTVSIGQGPCSIGHVPVEHGRWPNRLVSFSVPGALPLATINMAFGQQFHSQMPTSKSAIE